MPRSFAKPAFSRTAVKFVKESLKIGHKKSPKKNHQQKNVISEAKISVDIK